MDLDAQLAAIRRLDAIFEDERIDVENGRPTPSVQMFVNWPADAPTS